MPVALIVLGAILIVVAFNNTHGQLAIGLRQDVPEFFVWGLAIVAILGLGYVPALKTPSRWLLGLVVLVIVLVNYKSFLDGIKNLQADHAPTGTVAPSPAYTSALTGKEPTLSQVAGTVDAGGAGGGPAAAGGGGSSAAAGFPLDQVVGGILNSGNVLSSVTGLGGGVIQDFTSFVSPDTFVSDFVGGFIGGLGL